MNTRIAKKVANPFSRGIYSRSATREARRIVERRRARYPKPTEGPRYTSRTFGMRIEVSPEVAQIIRRANRPSARRRRRRALP